MHRDDVKWVRCQHVARGGSWVLRRSISRYAVDTFADVTIHVVVHTLPVAFASQTLVPPKDALVSGLHV